MKYKDQYGTPNEPCIYKTPEGYKLGEWQARQRHSFKKGIPSKDKVQRLEKIGFKWKLKKKNMEKNNVSH